MPQPLLHRIHELLASPRAVWWIVALAIILGLPTLDIGLVGDDLAQYGFLRGQHEGSSKEPWWNMFALAQGPRQRNIGLRTSGRAPWWLDPDLRVVFFRPLSVATHHLDHLLWPRQFWLMHLHNVLWHALVCALAWALARRLSSSPVAAGVTALVYTVSFSHVVPVAWLAHRNGLISTAFALACLIAHDAWRREGRRLGAVLSPVLLLLGLLSAEAAIVTLAFLLAYALFYDEAPLGARLLSLAPALAVTLAWRLPYSAMGFGATGSGAYWDPIRDPLGYLDNLPLRYGWLISTSVSPPLLAGFPPYLWLVLTCLSGAAVLGFAVLERSRVAGFGLAAVVLGCIPLTASLPGDRLLILTSFGGALAFAELLTTWGPEAAHRMTRTTALFVGLVRMLAPVLGGLYLASNLDEIGPEDGSIPLYAPALDDEQLARQGLVIVHAPNYVSAIQLPQVRQLRGLHAPNFTWILHEGPEAPVIRRLDDRTIELRGPHGWPSNAFSSFWRSTTHKPFTLGETIKTIDYTAEVKEVEDGRATVVEFRFRTALAHPTFAWVEWDGEEFTPFDPDERWRR